MAGDDKEGKTKATTEQKKAALVEMYKAVANPNTAVELAALQPGNSRTNSAAMPKIRQMLDELGYVTASQKDSRNYLGRSDGNPQFDRKGVMDFQKAVNSDTTRTNKLNTTGVLDAATVEVLTHVWAMQHLELKDGLWSLQGYTMGQYNPNVERAGAAPVQPPQTPAQPQSTPAAPAAPAPVASAPAPAAKPSAANSKEILAIGAAYKTLLGWQGPDAFPSKDAQGKDVAANPFPKVNVMLGKKYNAMDRDEKAMFEQLARLTYDAVPATGYVEERHKTFSDHLAVLKNNQNADPNGPDTLKVIIRSFQTWNAGADGPKFKTPIKQNASVAEDYVAAKTDGTLDIGTLYGLTAMAVASQKYPTKKAKTLGNEEWTDVGTTVGKFQGEFNRSRNAEVAAEKKQAVYDVGVTYRSLTAKNPKSGLPLTQELNEQFAVTQKKEITLLGQKIYQFPAETLRMQYDAEKELQAKDSQRKSEPPLVNPIDSILHATYVGKYSNPAKNAKDYNAYRDAVLKDNKMVAEIKAFQEGVNKDAMTTNPVLVGALTENGKKPQLKTDGKLDEATLTAMVAVTVANGSHVFKDGSQMKYTPDVDSNAAIKAVKTTLQQVKSKDPMPVPGVAPKAAAAPVAKTANAGASNAGATAGEKEIGKKAMTTETEPPTQAQARQNGWTKDALLDARLGYDLASTTENPTGNAKIDEFRVVILQQKLYGLGNNGRGKPHAFYDVKDHGPLTNGKWSATDAVALVNFVQSHPEIKNVAGSFAKIDAKTAANQPNETLRLFIDNAEAVEAFNDAYSKHAETKLGEKLEGAQAKYQGKAEALLDEKYKEKVQSKSVAPSSPAGGASTSVAASTTTLRAVNPADVFGDKAKPAVQAFVLTKLVDAGVVKSDTKTPVEDQIRKGFETLVLEHNKSISNTALQLPNNDRGFTDGWGLLTQKVDDRIAEKAVEKNVQDLSFKLTVPGASTKEGTPPAPAAAKSAAAPVAATTPQRVDVQKYLNGNAEEKLVEARKLAESLAFQGYAVHFQPLGTKTINNASLAELQAPINNALAAFADKVIPAAKSVPESVLHQVNVQLDAKLAAQKGKPAATPAVGNFQLNVPDVSPGTAPADRKSAPVPSAQEGGAAVVREIFAPSRQPAKPHGKPVTGDATPKEPEKKPLNTTPVPPPVSTISRQEAGLGGSISARPAANPVQGENAAQAAALIGLPANGQGEVVKALEGAPPQNGQGQGGGTRITTTTETMLRVDVPATAKAATDLAIARWKAGEYNAANLSLKNFGKSGAVIRDVSGIPSINTENAKDTLNTIRGAVSREAKGMRVDQFEKVLQESLAKKYEPRVEQIKAMPVGDAKKAAEKALIKDWEGEAKILKNQIFDGRKIGSMVDATEMEILFSQYPEVAANFLKTHGQEVPGVKTEERRVETKAIPAVIEAVVTPSPANTQNLRDQAVVGMLRDLGFLSDVPKGAPIPEEKLKSAIKGFHHAIAPIYGFQDISASIKGDKISPETENMLTVVTEARRVMAFDAVEKGGNSDQKLNVSELGKAFRAAGVTLNVEDPAVKKALADDGVVDKKELGEILRGEGVDGQFKKVAKALAEMGKPGVNVNDAPGTAPNTPKGEIDPKRHNNIG